MSFTEDELQAFHSILEQRLTAHRQEMEQALDQRLNEFRQGVDQRLLTFQQEVMNALNQRLADAFSSYQKQVIQTVLQERDQQQQHIESAVDRMLAAHLFGMEQLLNQHVSLGDAEASALIQKMQPQLDSIEVQTEIPWDDLADVMGKMLDERLAPLSSSLQHSVANLEQYLAVRLHSLQDELVRNQGNGQNYNGSFNGMSSLQEILEGISHLEHIVESMQVAMTANHALLSNRLYHHQQLPLERAHPVGLSHVEQTNESISLLARAKDRLAHDQLPILPDQEDHAGGTDQ